MRALSSLKTLAALQVSGIADPAYFVPVERGASREVLADRKIRKKKNRMAKASRRANRK